MTTQQSMDERLWQRYERAIQGLLNDGMPLEELTARMVKFQHLDLNHQARVMETMRVYRRGGDLSPLKI